MAPAELTGQSFKQIRTGLDQREFSVSELLGAYLHNIDQRESVVHVFLHIDRAGAEAAAKHLDQRLTLGEARPPLLGAVVAVKDNIAVRGLPMTAASRILEGYLPPYDATVVSRLRAAGALIIGKTNLDEFAMGSSTEHSSFGPTTNPHDPRRVPGGSSGGSAAAVAAGFCNLALGSDTGGSIRQPAAFCGVVGMRPTYGTVSRYGLIALASSMDVIGPLARSVADARTLLSVIGGYDRADSTSVPHFNWHRTASSVDLTKLRIGIPTEYGEGITDAEVKKIFNKSRALLERAGITVVEVGLPTTRYAVPAYYVITPAEASSNLARYDGIRFGPPGDHDFGHGRAYARLRGQRFGPEPKRRILLGTFTLSAGYAERYYHTAQRVRTLLRQDFMAAFAKADVLLTPATPTTAFLLGSIQDPVSMYRQDAFMVAVSLAGLPAVTVPGPAAGLPVGLQFIGQHKHDNHLLDVVQRCRLIFGGGE